MKRWSKKKIFGIWFLCFAVLAVIVNEIPGATYIDTATGESRIHSIAAWSCVFISIALTFLLFKQHNCGRALFRKLTLKKPSTSEDDMDRTDVSQEDEPLKIPFSRKARESLASSLLFDGKFYSDLANKDTSVRDFLRHYDFVLSNLKKLKQLEGKVKFQGTPTLDYYRLTEELQWHLCDAIERAQDAALDEIKGKFRNSVEYQQKRANSFLHDIEDCRKRFSQSTEEFAEKALTRVLNAAGLSNYNYTKNKLIESTQILDLSMVDVMEGHNFEFWCADLLRKNGFENVKVTPGSGDQGVDVLAEKGGVKYAIQCKCYSHDLGNTSIQEVESGRVFYGCHVGVVMTNRYFTQGAKELAQKTGTLLWDRDYLESAIKREPLG